MFVCDLLVRLAEHRGCFLLATGKMETPVFSTAAGGEDSGCAEWSFWD